MIAAKWLARLMRVTTAMWSSPLGTVRLRDAAKDNLEPISADSGVLEERNPCRLHRNAGSRQPDPCPPAGAVRLLQVEKPPAPERTALQMPQRSAHSRSTVSRRLYAADSRLAAT
jgi:hypothetical protein